MKLFTRKRPPITCRQVVEVVSVYLEDALSPPERARIEVHLSRCPDCVVYVEQVRVTIALTAAIPAEGLSPAVQQELRAAFRAWARP